MSSLVCYDVAARDLGEKARGKGHKIELLLFVSFLSAAAAAAAAAAEALPTT